MKLKHLGKFLLLSLISVFFALSLTACQSEEDKAREELDPIFQSINNLGVAQYADTVSSDEVNKTINDYYSYMTDEEQETILQVLGCTKIRVSLISDIKSGLKSPSSFELIEYDAMNPIWNDDDKEYLVMVDVTYSGVNDYNVRKEKTVMADGNFSIDTERKTVTIKDASVLSI